MLIPLTIKENTMKDIIEIKEEVKIGNVILEKGDKIEVIESDYTQSHLMVIYNMFKGSKVDVELSKIDKLNHHILKLSSTQLPVEKIKSVLDSNFSWGIAGNGLKYKVMRKGEIWVFGWDLDLDKKWSNIWSK